MSEKREYTAREIVDLQRAAAKAMAERLDGLQYAWRGLDHEIATLFPYPKVTRPRVVTRQDGVQLRIEGEELQFRISPNCSWEPYSFVCLSPANRAALLDLLANPTEEVEE